MLPKCLAAEVSGNQVYYKCNKLQKVPIAMHCNLQAALRRAMASFGTVLGQICIPYRACVKVAISEVLLKILTSPLDSATQIS